MRYLTCCSIILSLALIILVEETIAGRGNLIISSINHYLVKSIIFVTFMFVRSSTMRRSRYLKYKRCCQEFLLKCILGVCGPYSQCLQVDNLKRRSEDSLDWTQTISRALKKWQAKPDAKNSPGVGNTNGTAQTVLCACMPHHIGAPPKCRPLSCAANADCPSQFSCVKLVLICETILMERIVLRRS